MTTFEKLTQNEDFKKKFREEYNSFNLSENEKFIKERFNFSKKELMVLGHNKISQLFEITKDWNFHNVIYSGYYEQPIEGYEKSLMDVLLENDNIISDEIIKHIKDVFDKNETRAKKMMEQEQNEFNIPHSKAEQEYNLYCNLLEL